MTGPVHNTQDFGEKLAFIARPMTAGTSIKRFHFMHDRLRERKLETTAILPKEGVEPSCPCGHTILSRARLPVPPLRLIRQYYRYLPVRNIKEFYLLAEITVFESTVRWRWPFLPVPPLRRTAFQMLCAAPDVSNERGAPKNWWTEGGSNP